MTLIASMIRLVDEFGPFPAGRPSAEQMRARIEQAVAAGEHVVVDFDGVEAVSPSFADELFAKLPADVLRDGHLELTNVPAELSALIDFVVSGRELA